MDRNYLKKVLESPLRPNWNWTVQGFGKIGCTFAHNAKLHIWDRSVLNPRVPCVHSHSYNFKSFVVVGCVRNLKLYEAPDGELWNKVLVTAASQIVDGPMEAKLKEHPVEIHKEGAVYSQPYDEVHMSMPDDGTVTVVNWEFGQDPKHMKVYWRGRLPWADAKGRPATNEEVTSIAKNALNTWY